MTYTKSHSLEKSRNIVMQNVILDVELILKYTHHISALTDRKILKQNSTRS